MSSSVRFHSQSASSSSARRLSSQLTRHELGTQKRRDAMITVPTTLSLRNLRKLLMLISSMKSQIRTISWLVFSQVPLLQNPWKQGVPSGRMSTGATALQEELRLRRQQRLQASALLSHMQDCSPCVSQNGMHFPARHFPFSMQLVPSAMCSDLGHWALTPLHSASFSQVA